MTTPSGGEATTAGKGLRLLALVLAAALAFGTAVLVLVVLELIDTPICGPSPDLLFGEDCYLGSSTERLLGIVLLSGGAIFGAVSTLLAIGFTIGAKTGRRLVISTAIGLVLTGVALALF